MLENSIVYCEILIFDKHKYLSIILLGEIVAMTCLEGFKEKYGKELLREEYVKRVLFDIASDFNYKKIVIPILERENSFSEQIVGNSPWPEWNKKSCFYFDIHNYYDDYSQSQKEKVLLIPEGTVSVTRWIADQIEVNKVKFPIKLFYMLNCYRNELISMLTETKRREFEQFGLEILGSDSLLSDVEALNMVCLCLERLGVNKNCMRPRINNVAIYRMLVKDSKISERNSLVIKECLDNIAESKAGKHPELLQKYKNKIYEILESKKLSKKCKLMWRAIIESSYNELDKLKSVFDSKYHAYFNELDLIRENFALNDINILIDPCVIRSHEYYTGLSFEFDVIVENAHFIEIAGGGRYDRLVGRFLIQHNKIDKVPCTGFAFGFERLIDMLDKLGLFRGKKQVKTLFCFGQNSKKQVKAKSIQHYFELSQKKNLEILID